MIVYHEEIIDRIKMIKGVWLFDGSVMKYEIVTWGVREREKKK